MNYANSNLDTLGLGEGKVAVDDTLGCDGNVVHYESQLALSPIGGNANEFSGEDREAEVEFYNADGEDADEFYNARGGLFGNFRKNQKKRQARRDLRTKSKAEARKTRTQAGVLKAKAKQDQAKAQVESAKASQLGVQADTLMAQSLGASAPQPEQPSTGMSKGLKIGLIVGGVVLLGVIGFIVYKSMAKKGGKTALKTA
jgi:hypothetical protein